MQGAGIVRARTIAAGVQIQPAWVYALATDHLKIWRMCVRGLVSKCTGNIDRLRRILSIAELQMANQSASFRRIKCET